VIDTENLTRKFGNLTAVDNLNLHVHVGEVFGFLGPNGAGKTTTVRMLCCLIAKTSGEAKVAGYDIANPRDAIKIRQAIGFVPDNVGLYEDLTAYENLDYYGKLYKVPEVHRKENIKRFLEMLGLWEKRDVVSGAFSKGMKQKLALARALIHDPELLFMDEPTANLDPESAKTVRDFIIQLKREKKTIFLNTHNLDESQRICDRIAILNTRLMAVGTPQELEHSVGKRRTEIQLEKITDEILAALTQFKLAKSVQKENKLSIELSEPERANPDIINAIVGAGGRIQSVVVSGSSIEEAYLKLVKEERKNQ
jgi:ABC-2 type transport system ATP-binding protein